MRACALGAWTAAVLAIGVWNARRGPVRERIEIALAGWPDALDGYRIVQLSDVHISSLIRREYAQRLVDHCAALAPDLIAVTGDLVDGSVRSLHDEVAPFAALRARDGVYFVTGNHDHYSDEEPWVERVRELGMTVLRNQRVSITRGAARFELAGVDDFSTHRRASRARHSTCKPRLRVGMARRRSCCSRMIHAASSKRATHGVQLQLSGHTHGGQMWPFGVFVRLQTRWVAGLYRSGRVAALRKSRHWFLGTAGSLRSTRGDHGNRAALRAGLTQRGKSHCRFVLRVKARLNSEAYTSKLWILP